MLRQYDVHACAPTPTKPASSLRLLFVDLIAPVKGDLPAQLLQLEAELTCDVVLLSVGEGEPTNPEPAPLQELEHIAQKRTLVALGPRRMATAREDSCSTQAHRYSPGDSAAATRASPSIKA
jgi:hypothetical protein